MHHALFILGGDIRSIRSGDGPWIRIPGQRSRHRRSEQATAILKQQRADRRLERDRLLWSKIQEIAARTPTAHPLGDSE
jgi:hypothetical protein